MKNPLIRRLMLDIYFLLEKYENPSRDPDYWISLVNACNILCQKYSDNPLALMMINALYNGLEELYHV